MIALAMVVMSPPHVVAPTVRPYVPPPVVRPYVRPYIPPPAPIVVPPIVVPPHITKEDKKEDK